MIKLNLRGFMPGGGNIRFIMVCEYTLLYDIYFYLVANLTYIVPYFEKMKESTDIIWALQGI
jgi:hypothetical protein